MLPRICNRTVTVERAALREARGTAERDWADTESHQIAGCMIQATGTSGSIADRENGTVTATLIAPPSADVETGDAVEYGGRRYRVASDPYDVEGVGLAYRAAPLADWEG